MVRHAVFSLATVSFMACGPIPFSTQLKGEAVIAGSPLGGVLNVFPQLGAFSNLDFDQNQDFKNNDATRARVKTMKVTAFSLRILSPTDQDFTFLDTIEFVVKSGDQEQKIAGKTGIRGLRLPAPNPTLTLDLVDVDLAAFVQSPTMTIISRGTGRQPTQDTRVEATVKFTVGVGL